MLSVEAFETIGALGGGTRVLVSQEYQECKVDGKSDPGGSIYLRVAEGYFVRNVHRQANAQRSSLEAWVGFLQECFASPRDAFNALEASQAAALADKVLMMQGHVGWDRAHQQARHTLPSTNFLSRTAPWH